MGNEAPGGNADDAEFGQPLPPEDRLWRHPSELSRSAATPAPSLSPSGSSTPPGSTSGLPLNPTAPGNRPRPGFALVGAGVIGGMLSAVLTVGGLYLGGAFDRQIVERAVQASSQPVAKQAVFTLPEPQLSDTDTTSPADIAKRMESSLVRIEVTSPMGSQNATALAVRNDGYYVTSAEVVRSASEIRLTEGDGEPVSAELIGLDEWTNLAVLRVKGGSSRTAIWGSSTSLTAGTDVIVVGAAPEPTGNPQVAGGLINAVRARYTVDSGRTLHDLLRVDVNMLPGSRGGALVDGDGAVIGIISTVGRDENGVKGVGYATPIEVVRDVATDIVERGSPVEARLGIEGLSLTDEEADALQVSGGVKIQIVTPESPAEIAGLAPGDVIVTLNNEPVLGMNPLVMKLRSVGPGNKAALSYIRGGVRIDTLTILSVETTDPPSVR